MLGHGGSSAGSYLADPTSPIPSHCAVNYPVSKCPSASIVATSTLRVNYVQISVNQPHWYCFSQSNLLVLFQLINLTGIVSVSQTLLVLFSVSQPYWYCFSQSTLLVLFQSINLTGTVSVSQPYWYCSSQSILLVLFQSVQPYWYCFSQSILLVLFQLVNLTGYCFQSVNLTGTSSVNQPYWSRSSQQWTLLVLFSVSQPHWYCFSQSTYHYCFSQSDTLCSHSLYFFPQDAENPA